MTCQYSTAFLDREYRVVTFKCEEETEEDGLCVFHHPTYWEKNQDEVREKFYGKVKRAVEKGEKLICIGYNLPEIEFEPLEFKAPYTLITQSFTKTHRLSPLNSLKMYTFSEQNS